jgi:hypothetical protein
MVIRNMQERVAALSNPLATTPRYRKDPMSSDSTIKVSVEDIQLYFDEFLKRGTITKEKLRRNTPWGTHEFGFYDLNRSAIFAVQDM